MPNLPRRYAVSTGSDSDPVVVDCENRDCQDYYPVAIAPGTDLIRKLGHYDSDGFLDFCRVAAIPDFNNKSDRLSAPACHQHQKMIFKSRSISSLSGTMVSTSGNIGATVLTAR